MRVFRSRRSRLLLAAALAAVAAAVAAAVPLGAGGGGAARSVAAGAPSSPGPYICGKPVLDSPWSYNGPAVTFTSGQFPGLPTYGAAGTDFPAATAGIIVPAGNNTAAASAGTYRVNSTVVYFEPGTHDIEAQMFTGHDSYYVGGYTAGLGEATLDGVDGATGGTGLGGANLSVSTPSSGSNVYDTWEYLTIENYTSSNNNSVMGNINGGGPDDGDTYKHDTIGPNEYGYAGAAVPPATGENSGGGYAINAGSNTTIEYDCLTQNAQGGFNAFAVINLDVAGSEISWNGLGEYPDTAGPGASTHACGCSGGGKAFYSLNTNVVGNYVHDNYNAGIWLDFDNAGADISHNYVASNWGEGIFFEASYNSVISGNTLTGNGWASDGPWPAGVGGLDCFGGIPCSAGYGPITGAGGGFPYSAIYIPNSGGNANLASVSVPSAITVPGCVSSCTLPVRYAGKVLVQGNVLKDNFGGVMVYTDTNRFPGNINDDSACGIALGVLNQANSATYGQQTKVLVTAADASVSGSSVTSTGGTTTICSDYGSPGPGGGAASAVQAPSAGMAVYNQATGTYLGDVATVTSATSFTLTDSPGSVTGASLLLSSYGGCGPADYFGGAAGVTSGTPPALYWDNCIWGSQNITVSGNSFSLDAGTVTGCTTGNMCGYMALLGFVPGVPPLLQYWSSYTSLVGRASGGLGNSWLGNAYTWKGGGPGGWQFTAGAQGTLISQAQWQASPYGQDAGSTFSG